MATLHHAGTVCCLTKYMRSKKSTHHSLLAGVEMFKFSKPATVANPPEKAPQ